MKPGNTLIGKDLNYEGIETSDQFLLFDLRQLQIGKDLNYEGIETKNEVPFMLSQRNNIGKDLNYEGIETYRAQSDIPRFPVLSEKT